jgi:hypothetical protein
MFHVYLCVWYLHIEITKMYKSKQKEYVYAKEIFYFIPCDYIFKVLFSTHGLYKEK